MRYDLVAERKGPDTKIVKAEDVWKATKRFHRVRKEHFLVLTLNGAHEVIRMRIVSIGIANRCVVVITSYSIHYTKLYDPFCNSCSFILFFHPVSSLA